MIAPQAHAFSWKRAALIAAGLAVPAVLLAGCVGPLRPHPVGNPDVPQPRKAVDLTRYLGHWYEIARYEQFFEKDCEAATADYTLRPDGKIGIVNGCRKPNGKWQDAKARAYVLPDTGNAKLKVSFFGPFFIGNYWVMDHADDYSWSIVGDPSGRYLWLLDRRPNPPQAEVAALIARAAALGYDTAMLRMTRQP